VSDPGHEQPLGLPVNWPPLPSPDSKQEFQKIRFQGEVDDAIGARERLDNTAWERTKRTEDRAFVLEDRDDDQAWQLRKADWDAELDLRKVIHDARVEVVKGSLERSRAAAEFIRNAAAGLVAAYGVIVGAAFSVDKARPLPATGTVPAIFLGFAVMAAAAYVGMISRSPDVEAPTPHSDLAVFQERRLNTFTAWVSGAVLTRAYFMHFAVLALGAGVVFTPAPFTSFNQDAVWISAGVAALVCLLLPLATSGAIPIEIKLRRRSGL
jgi:hypothetical protein